MPSTRTPRFRVTRKRHVYVLAAKHYRGVYIVGSESWEVTRAG
jgi:hypothetical protein